MQAQADGAGAAGLGSGQGGRETVGGQLLRTGSGLCLTVAGFAATALMASLSAGPTLTRPSAPT